MVAMHIYGVLQTCLMLSNLETLSHTTFTTHAYEPK